MVPMAEPFDIASRRIGAGRCFVIAEAGVNHNGDAAIAARLIDAAARAGADAVKFQTFRAEHVVSADAPKAAYQRATTGESEGQLDMVRALELPPSSFEALKSHAEGRGILFLSTPFDHDSVDLLHRLGVAAFKIASGEVTNLPLLRHVAALGKPVILSTGMSYLGEVEAAVGALRSSGLDRLALLHCVSNYPADHADVNLRAMATLRAAFAVPVGYSDHTTGIAVALAAAARGAAVLEKHFTLDRALPGPDHRASLEPAELSAMVAGIRTVESALGDGIKAPRPQEADTRLVARRSLFVRAPIAADQRFEAGHLIALRPAGGIGPEQIDSVIGRRALRGLVSGDRLDWRDVA